MKKLNTLNTFKLMSAMDNLVKTIMEIDRPRELMSAVNYIDYKLTEPITDEAKSYYAGLRGLLIVRASNISAEFRLP